MNGQFRHSFDSCRSNRRFAIIQLAVSIGTDRLRSNRSEPESHGKTPEAPSRASSSSGRVASNRFPSAACSLSDLRADITGSTVRRRYDVGAPVDPRYDLVNRGQTEQRVAGHPRLVEEDLGGVGRVPRQSRRFADVPALECRSVSAALTDHRHGIDIEVGEMCEAGELRAVNPPRAMAFGAVVDLGGEHSARNDRCGCCSRAAIERAWSEPTRWTREGPGLPIGSRVVRNCLGLTTCRIGKLTLAICQVRGLLPRTDEE
jgi:hypothetical protein